MLRLHLIFRMFSTSLFDFCVFHMAKRRRRAGLANNAPKQPSATHNALKYKESASLLFALIWFCLLSFGVVCVCFGLRGAH